MLARSVLVLPLVIFCAGVCADSVSSQSNCNVDMGQQPFNRCLAEQTMASEEQVARLADRVGRSYNGRAARLFSVARETRVRFIDSECSARAEMYFRGTWAAAESGLCRVEHLRQFTSDLRMLERDTERQVAGTTEVVLNDRYRLLMRAVTHAEGASAFPLGFRDLERVWVRYRESWCALENTVGTNREECFVRLAGRRVLDFEKWATIWFPETSLRNELGL